MADQTRSWWSEKDEDSRHRAALAAYGHLHQQEQRQEAYLEFMTLYTNRDVRSGNGGNTAGGNLAAATNISSNKYTRVPFNLIKLVIDTVAARIAKFRPRPRYLTDEGDFGLRRRADRLQKWVDMQFYTTEIYETGVRAFLDACIYGLGAIKVSRQDDEIRAERIYPGELLVDEHEAFFDVPRQIFQTKLIAREVVRAMFPKGKTEIIDRAERISDRRRFDNLAFDPLIDQIEVVETWHLRSGPKAKDGRKMIFVSSGVLADVEYSHHDFPFSFIRWNPEPRGFYGIGLAEDLLGIHLDVNTTIRKIERSLELTSSPQVWLEAGSRVDVKKITNIPGQVNFYTGTVPIYMTPQAVPRDVFAYLQQQVGRAFQIARISESSIGGGIPSGLETGAAVRNFHDIGSESFSLPARRYEDLFLDLARKYVRTGKEIAIANPDYTVVLEKDKHTVESVPWKDVQLDDRADAFIVKVFPASSLSTTPSGRMADIQDLLNMQLITPEEGKRLLDFEDLEEHMSLDRAAADNIDRIIEKILEKNVYEPPEPFMDLQLAMKKGQAAVNRSSRMGVPEPRIAKLRLFTRASSDLIKRAKAEELALAQAAVPQPAAAPPPDQTGQLPGAVTGQEIS